jgi:F-type H+-transporting ATPase subunit a
MDIHISFVPEKLFEIAGQWVTNSMFTAIVAIGLVIIFLTIYSFRLSAYKPGSFELLLEMLFEALNDLAENILGVIPAKKYLGFLMTFFVFVLVSNWAGLLPIVPALGVVKEEHEENTVEQSFAKEDNIIASTEIIATESNHSESQSEKTDLKCILTGKCIVTTQGVRKDVEFTPVFRAPTADLSSGLTLALISVIATNLIGIFTGKFGYLKKYFNFSDPINFVVGILELVSEIGKIISFAFRLFGNIFAGEVLLTVITAITFGIVTLPFLGLELFVGVIQALIFFMLTAVFIGLARETHH